MEKDRLSRKLAVILHADVVDSTALVRQDETLAHERIQDTFRRFSDTISNHDGVAHEVRGDALVAEFARASDAVSASLAFQAINTTHNEQLSDDLQPILRIGIAMGEVVIADNTVTGEGVVLAQRLEQLAKQGGVCIQGAAYETVPKRLPFEYENLGEQPVKGFDEPVKIYSVSLKPGSEIPEPEIKILPKSETPELTEKPSIAVLPFTNMSGDPEQEFFADGLTYDIIMGLSAVSVLFVIARASSFVYKESNADVKTIASELGVQYVLEGSVRRSADRCRVNVQLVDAESDSPVWSQKYDRELVDLFELQDDIMQSVVASVTTQVVLRAGRQSLEQSRTDIRLWDLLSQARSLTYGLTEDSIKESLKISERALSLFPDSGKANMSVANALYHLIILGYDMKREESLRRARDLGRRALELDEDDEWSHLVFAWILLEFGEFDQAIEGIERGIEINPNFSMLYGGMADALSYAGRSEEAIKNAMLALRLNPLDPANFFRFIAVARAYFCLGEYSDAIEWAKRALQRRPTLHEGHTLLIASLLTQGDLDRASNASARYLELFPETTVASLAELGTTAVQLQVHDREKVFKLLRKAGIPSDNS